MASKDDAKAVVDKFVLRSSVSVWPNIKRKQVADDLKQRIDDPNLISSDSTSLCGPAAFIRNLANDNPVMYAQALIDLYESGRAVVGTKIIKPGGDLKEYISHLTISRPLIGSCSQACGMMIIGFLIINP